MVRQFGNLKLDIKIVELYTKEQFVEMFKEQYEQNAEELYEQIVRVNNGKRKLESVIEIAKDVIEVVAKVRSRKRPNPFRS
jgi:hypothetical protein